jgi:hypothetical protein
MLRLRIRAWAFRSAPTVKGDPPMNSRVAPVALTTLLASGCLAVSNGQKPIQHVVTADQLAKEFSASELLFQEKYNGSHVQLTAKVSSIDKKTRPDDPSQPLVNLLTPKEYYSVYLTPKDSLHLASTSTVASMSCILSTNYAGWVRTLKNGYTITVKGDLNVSGSDFGYMTELQSCEPVSIDERTDGEPPVAKDPQPAASAQRAAK